jgi:hypothetical protein
MMFPVGIGYFIAEPHGGDVHKSHLTAVDFASSALFWPSA